MEEEKAKESTNVIIRKIGRWSVKDYTVERNPEIKKYLKKSFYLFPYTKTNSLLIDKESWYSITPKDTADSISFAIQKAFSKNVSVLDLFSGVGGNTISFVKHGFTVTSVESDYRKVKYLKHNLLQCFSTHSVNIVHGDVYDGKITEQVQNKYKAIVSSPPWGGVDYKNSSHLELVMRCRVFDLEEKYGDMSDLRIYLLPRRIPSSVFHRLFNCKVFKGMSNNYHVLNILVLGKDADLYDYK